jgi:hypothetical protein
MQLTIRLLSYRQGVSFVPCVRPVFQRFRQVRASCTRNSVHRIAEGLPQLLL